jgi:hypothetical protein
LLHDFGVLDHVEAVTGDKLAFDGDCLGLEKGLDTEEVAGDTLNLPQLSH